jgi:hypothetical protein
VDGGQFNLSIKCIDQLSQIIQMDKISVFSEGI